MTEAMMALATLESGGALTKRGLELPNSITLDRGIAVLSMLTEADDALQWAWGDALSTLETLYPEEFSQAAEAAGIDHHRKMQYIRISQAIPLEQRPYDLPWSHYRTVYTLDREQRDLLLQRAVNENWTRDQLADAKAELLGRSNGSNGLPAPSRTYVLERVSDAAERVWKAAQRQEDAYLVPADEFEQLAEALGVELGG